MRSAFLTRTACMLLTYLRAVVYRKRYTGVRRHKCGPQVAGSLKGNTIAPSTGICYDVATKVST
jgi:hypothetical protein